MSRDRDVSNKATARQLRRRTRPLLLAPGTLLEHHFVAAFWSLGSRFACPLAFGWPAPYRHRMLIGLGFTASTTVRMVTTTRRIRNERVLAYP